MIIGLSSDNNTLQGNVGDDVLYGGTGNDTLEGGSNYDSDGKGVVSFEGVVLSGKKDNDNYDDDKDGIINDFNNDGKYQTFIINNDANLNKQDTMINRIYKKVA